MWGAPSGTWPTSPRRLFFPAPPAPSLFSSRRCASNCVRRRSKGWPPMVRADRTRGRTEMSGLALEGVRVIDLSAYLSGPYCSMILADHGADVIKVERPGEGDEARRMPPFINGES